MAALETSIRTLLRPSDQVKVVLEVQVVPTLDEAGAPVVSSESGRAEVARSKRILVVVSHSDGPNNSHEEGSVFILKFKDPTRAFDQSDILRVFPVFGDFSISMAQVQQSVDLRPSSQPSPGLISLTITQGDAPGLEPLTLCTQNVQGLRDVLAECRRLKESADAPPSATPITTFSWLAPYTSRRPPLPSFTIPQDLRIGHKPLHTRLSRAFAGEMGDDFSDIVRIRDEWLRSRVRESSIKGTQSLSVRIGTFNVNGNLPSQDLSSWVRGETGTSDSTMSKLIPPLPDISPLSMGEVKNPFDPTVPTAPSQSALDEKTVDTNTEPDLLVLGFQELDLSTEALIYSTSTFKEDAWCTAIFAALGERAELYEKLASRQLVGILIVLIVKKSLRPSFTEIKTCAAGTGIMGLMGNKGGNAIRIKYIPATPDVANPGATVLTFVNAHLAAFDEMFEKRNADFHDLSKRLQFDLGETQGSVEGHFPVPVTCNVYESDALFWMANLNYRVDVPDADMRRILASEEWDNKFETLLKYDQVWPYTSNPAMNAKAFTIFSEGVITHLPTYRFNAGLLKDDLGYDLKRRPAWTDRVLYVSNAFARIEQLSYAADHRPVSADFVDIFDELAAEATAEKLYKRLDGLEDAHEDTNARVNLKIMNPSYQKEVSQQVAIHNIGKVPCAYRLVPIDDSSSAVHPDWLKVEPMSALLLPDELAYITLTVKIDNNSASRLNIDHTELDCTLILHTVMGKDHFIAVTAKYEDRAINAPREIMRLVNWMMAPDINIEHIFTSAADKTIVDTIRECLDTGSDFPFSPNPKDEEVPIAFGETLLGLLDSLHEPIVPTELHAQCMVSTSRDEAFELLDAFPPAAVNVWISVTAFLHYVCQSSTDPVTKTWKIAGIFAPILMRDGVNPVSPVGRRNFLLYFIS
ncbi:DNase I-like protein [Mycena rebaudengoi]|nr:DNase I-like protein [Mycena rebaudengoi]